MAALIRQSFTRTGVVIRDLSLERSLRGFCDFPVSFSDQPEMRIGQVTHSSLAYSSFRRQLELWVCSALPSIYAVRSSLFKGREARKKSATPFESVRGIEVKMGWKLEVPLSIV
jgi:hypothetical protein